MPETLATLAILVGGRLVGRPRGEFGDQWHGHAG